MNIDTNQLQQQIAKGLVYKGWIQAPVSDAWLLESFGITVGKRSGLGWDNCTVPHPAFVKMKDRWGCWTWELTPMPIYN